MNQRETFIALNLIEGLGAASVHRLVKALGSAEKIFGAGEARLRALLGHFATPEVVAQLGAAGRGIELKMELQRAQGAGVQIRTVSEPGYPQRLKEISDPPPVLYLKGTLVEEDEAAVSVVGTRRASAEGKAAASGLARALSRSGITVVSGLAEGIDAAAHRGALECGGRTLAVMGHGLAHLYPPIHEQLAGQVTRSGAMISEFPMESPPARDRFPRRNRVIAGLSLGVLVVEAPARSGALITAREALEQGREVFAVPGPIASGLNGGSHQLLRDGAKLVEKVSDILEELAPQLQAQLRGWKQREPQLSAETVFTGSLSRDEEKVYQSVPAAGSAGVESLLKRTRLPASELLPVLTGLEMKGWISHAPGRGIARVR